MSCYTRVVLACVVHRDTDRSILHSSVAGSIPCNDRRAFPRGQSQVGRSLIPKALWLEINHCSITPIHTERTETCSCATVHLVTHKNVLVASCILLRLNSDSLSHPSF